MTFESTSESPDPRRSRRSKNGRRNKRQQKSARRNHAEYQTLEARMLLAVEVGLNFTGSIGGVDSNLTPPDTMGGVGPNHIVELINGRYKAYDKSDGTVLESKTLNDFWSDAGAVVLSTTFDPRIVYDPIESRWFASSIDGGAGNTIFVGISETDDPTGTWRSVQFQGDSTGVDFNDYDTLSVDANGVYLATNNFGPTFDVSIFSIPKRDLLGPTPSIFRMTRFENLDASVYGNSIQVGLDYDVNARGIALGTFSSGTSIVRTDIVGPSGPGAGLSVPAEITVPFYEQAPEGRQLGGRGLENVSPRFTGNVIRNNGNLWAVHAVMGSSGNSAARWYKIDIATNTLADWGTIEDPEIDYLDPSIAVNDYGVIAIGFTATGPNQFPSAAATFGYTVNGLVTPTIEFGETKILRAGLEAYDSGSSRNRWGDYSATQVDPDDPFSFWTFQEWANTGSNWSTRISETGLFDVTPTVRANALDNDIIIRSSPMNSDWVEVSIDGTVTDIFERRSLTGLNVDAADGNDSIVIDYSFGDPMPFSGITVRGGDGYDIVEVSGGTVGHNWIVNGDGSGTIDGNSRFFNFEELIGSDNADRFEVRETGTDLIIRAGDGNDELFVTGPIVGQLTLMGEAGDDNYRVPIETITSIIIIDSIGSESDVLTAFATNGDDVITLNNSTVSLNGSTTVDFIVSGVEAVAIDGLQGNDIFNIQAILDPFTFFGSEGQDLFNVSSDAPVNLGNSDSLNNTLSIDGGAGRNKLVVSAFSSDSKNVVVTDNKITGIGTSDINYVATGGNFGPAGADAGIVLIGSDTGGDQFEIVSLLEANRLRVNAGGGTDRMVVRGGVFGDVDLDGQVGSDVYQVAMEGLGGRTVIVGDTGGGDVDRVAVTVSDRDDVFSIQNDTIQILSERLVTGFQTEVLVVNTLVGNDIVTVKNNNVDNIRVLTGVGEDRVSIQGTRGIKNLRIETGTSNDQVSVERSVVATYLLVNGGSGADTIDVLNTSYASGRFDGQDDADLVMVDFIGRTNRVINARDTGSGGDDNLLVTGTGGIDRYMLRTQSLSNLVERVLFDGNTERLNANPGNGNDIVTVFGSLAPITQISTGQGDDLVQVESTSGAQSLLIETGFGNDDINVRTTSTGASVVLRGEGGNDVFRIGSTAAENDGNLGRIRGRIHVNGGVSAIEDRLLVNDRGATGAYDYFVSSTQVVDLGSASSLPRDIFAGVFHNSVEFVRVDGTDQQNQFNVRPGDTTRFYIDGNLPVQGQLNGLRGDYLNLLGDGSDGRWLTTDNKGNGVWRFTDGTQDVRFESIEDTNVVAGSRSNGSNKSGDQNGPQYMRVTSDTANNPALAGSIQLDDIRDALEQELVSVQSMVDDVFASEQDFGSDLI